MTISIAWRWLAVVAVLLASVAAAGERLEPVPDPDLEPLEPSVREALTRARAGFEQAREQADSDQALGEVYGQLGAWYQVHGLNEEALVAYRNAVTLSPLRFEWQYLLAGVHEELDRISDAITHYGEAINIDPGYVPARVRRGRLHLDLGDADSALADFEAARVQDAQVPAVHAGLGQALLADGRYAEAIEALSRALELDPEASALYNAMAQAWRNLGEVDRAREMLARQGSRQAAMADPVATSVLRLSRSSQTYFQAGMAQGEAGNHALAAELIRQAIGLRPEHVPYFRALGEQLYRAGELAEAREVLTQAAAMDRTHADLYQNIGVVEFEMGEFEDAAESFDTALALGRDAIELKLLRERARMMAGDIDSAIAGLDELAANSDEWDALEARYWQGMALLLDDRCEAAERLFEQVWDQSGERHGSALMALVRVRASCSDASEAELDEALDWARMIYEALPSPETLETLAMAYAAVGRMDDAVDAQAMAVFEVHRNNLTDRFPDLQGNMERYTNGQRAERPYSPADPILARVE